MDRNFLRGRMDLEITPSLSARRAWIEMWYRPAVTSPSPVALRKESVDRNSLGVAVLLAPGSRSPQGERG